MRQRRRDDHAQFNREKRRSKISVGMWEENLTIGYQESNII